LDITGKQGMQEEVKKPHPHGKPASHGRSVHSVHVHAHDPIVKKPDPEPAKPDIHIDFENKYVKRFEKEFRTIMGEIKVIKDVIPQFKTENESLRERIHNIRQWAEVASKVRYQSDANADAVLANLITQILLETDNVEELKPVLKEAVIHHVSDEIFTMLNHAPNQSLEEAMQGFDFYENNPYKKIADKKIKKFEKKKKKGK